MIASIRRRLTWKLIAALAVPIAAGAVGAFVIVRHSLLEEFDATLIARAGTIASMTRQDSDRIAIDTDSRFMRRFEARDEDARKHEREDDDDTAYFEMWRPNGTMVARSGSLAARDLPFVPPAAGGERRRAWDISMPPGVAIRAVALQFVPRLAEPTTAVRGPLVLVVAANRSEIDRTLQTLAVVLGGSGAVLLAGVFIVVPRVLRRELRPIDRLADQAASVTPESLSTRFAVDDAPSELVPIVGRLNDLLERLEAAFERERQFSADVAHELRTPLAELRSLAEVAVKWPDNRPSDTDHDVLAVALQLEGIVTRLLALLRSERGQLALARQETSLSSEVEAAWRPFVGRARARRLRVSIDVDRPIAVTTDPVFLRSILISVCDNASEYTPEGGAVSISAAAPVDGGWRVLVANDVTDLTAADVSRMFDRFWRSDRARAASEHSGLGLSVARAFARMIDTELTARLDAGRLTMELKAATQ